MKPKDMIPSKLTPYRKVRRIIESERGGEYLHHQVSGYLFSDIQMLVCDRIEKPVIKQMGDKIKRMKG